MKDLVDQLSREWARMLEQAEQSGACEQLNILRGLTPDQAVAHHDAPFWAYWYARRVICGRWPEAEALIATNAELAYWYACDVIHGRWPEAEAVIARDANMAYCYARNVICGRWPEAEPAIAADTYWDAEYARHVIRGPRPA